MNVTKPLIIDLHHGGSPAVLLHMNGQLQRSHYVQYMFDTIYTKRDFPSTLLLSLGHTHSPG